MAKKAFRTILCTYRDMSMEEFENLKAENNDFKKPEDRGCLEQNLIAIGMFGLQDPLRKGIRKSINICLTSEIKVLMCTGDNIDTAIAISKNAGIIKDGDE